jgi:hypothetical protein
VEAELTSTEHSIQEVIFNMVEKYIYIKQEEKSNEVFFTKFQEKVKDELRDVTYHNSF